MPPQIWQFLAQAKLYIYYKHLKTAALKSHLGIKKMDRFLADLAHQEKPETLKQYSNLDYNPDFYVNLECIFTHKT